MSETYDVTVLYKGQPTLAFNESGLKTLHTAGKYLEGNIIINYQKYTPQETLNITENGTYDISGYASVVVNVSSGPTSVTLTYSDGYGPYGGDSYVVTYVDTSDVSHTNNYTESEITSLNITNIKTGSTLTFKAEGGIDSYVNITPSTVPCSQSSDTFTITMNDDVQIGFSGLT